MKLIKNCKRIKYKNIPQYLPSWYPNTDKAKIFNSGNQKDNQFINNK